MVRKLEAGGRAPESMKGARYFVSGWLKEAMEHAGINQSELARRIGYDQSKVNRMVHKSRSMSAAEMVMISAVTGYGLDGAIGPVAQTIGRNGTSAPEKVPQAIGEAFGVCERLSLPPSKETITRLVVAILAEDGASS